MTVQPPYYVNIYVDHLGKTFPGAVKAPNREISRGQSHKIKNLNSRVRVTSLKQAEG